MSAIRISAYNARTQQVSQRDLRAILAFLEKLYHPNTLAGFREMLGGLLRELIPCELAAYSEMNPDERQSVHLGSPSGVLTSELNRERWLPVMHEHPVLMHARQTGDLSAGRISDFYSQVRFRETGLYREFYRQLSIEDALCKAISASGPVVIGASFQRDRRSFSDRECLIFDLIGPHLTQAWRNAREVSRLADLTVAQNKALEDLDCDIINLDGRGQVRWMSPRARFTLERFFGAASTQNSLPLALSRWVKKTKQSLLANPLTQPQEVFEAKRGRDLLVVRLVAWRSQHILIVKAEYHGGHPLITEQLGLTPREAEVLSWVSDGKTNAEIAEIVRASPRTVQKHLENAFQKLGVETRTAAAMKFREVRRGRMT